MRLFDFFKRKKTGIPAVAKTQVAETKASADVSIRISVHEDIKNLLWFGDGPNMNLTEEQMSADKGVFNEYSQFISVKISMRDEEPSLIYTKLPFKKPADESATPRPPYFPKYKDLTPEQRYIYFKLLTDPYNTDIDIGYVFILYYGLERHLLQGDFEGAFHVILKLRDVHKNKSFQQYSGNALILSAMLKGKGEYIPEFIKSLDKEYELQFSDNLFLVCYYSFNIPLLAKDIMRMAKTFEFSNTNYIKKCPDIFEKCLREVIAEKTRSDNVDIKKYITNAELKKIRTADQTIFSNSSIVGNKVSVPMLSENFKLKKEINIFLEEAHEKAKQEVAGLRKKGTFVETPPPQKEKKSVKSEPSAANMIGGITRYKFIKYQEILKTALDETADFDKAYKNITAKLKAEALPEFEKFLKYTFENRSEDQKELKKRVAAGGSSFTGLIEWIYKPEEEGECAVCREIASRDIGYGPGVYPVDKVPAIPHPGCWCNCYPKARDAKEVADELFEKYFGEDVPDDYAPEVKIPSHIKVNPTKEDFSYKAGCDVDMKNLAEQKMPKKNDK